MNSGRTYTEQEKIQIAKEIAKDISNATQQTINNLDDTDETLLHKAIIIGNNLHVDSCLKKGAIVYQRDFDLAIKEGYYQIQKALNGKKPSQGFATDVQWNAQVLAAQNARSKVTLNPTTTFSAKPNDSNGPKGNDKSPNIFTNKPFAN